MYSNYGSHDTAKLFPDEFFACFSSYCITEFFSLSDLNKKKLLVSLKKLNEKELSHSHEETGSSSLGPSHDGEKAPPAPAPSSPCPPSLPVTDHDDTSQKSPSPSGVSQKGSTVLHLNKAKKVPCKDKETVVDPSTSKICDSIKLSDKCTSELEKTAPLMPNNNFSDDTSNKPAKPKSRKRVIKVLNPVEGRIVKDIFKNPHFKTVAKIVTQQTPSNTKSIVDKKAKPSFENQLNAGNVSLKANKAKTSDPAVKTVAKNPLQIANKAKPSDSAVITDAKNPLQITNKGKPSDSAVKADAKSPLQITSKAKPSDSAVKTVHKSPLQITPTISKTLRNFRIPMKNVKKPLLNSPNKDNVSDTSPKESPSKDISNSKSPTKLIEQDTKILSNNTLTSCRKVDSSQSPTNSVSTATESNSNQKAIVIKKIVKTKQTALTTETKALPVDSKEAIASKNNVLSSQNNKSVSVNNSNSNEKQTLKNNTIIFKKQLKQYKKINASSPTLINEDSECKEAVTKTLVKPSQSNTITIRTKMVNKKGVSDPQSVRRSIRPVKKKRLAEGMMAYDDKASSSSEEEEQEQQNSAPVSFNGVITNLQNVFLSFRMSPPLNRKRRFRPRVALCLNIYLPGYHRV